MSGQVKISGCSTADRDNFSMWKGSWRGTMPLTMSGQIIVIADPCVLGFDRMFQRFEVTAPDMNIHALWDIDKEHCSFIAWWFLAYRAVIHEGWLVRGWKDAFIM